MDFLFTGWILGNTVLNKKDVIKISFSILRSMFICMLPCFVNLNLIIYLVIVIIGRTVKSVTELQFFSGHHIGRWIPTIIPTIPTVTSNFPTTCKRPGR